MTSPHEKLPWHCLTEHVDFDGSIGFKVRPDSKIDDRKQAFAHFTRALASLIVEAAEEQLSHLPKPDASRDEWRDVGVQDDALFPVDLVDAFNDFNADNTKFFQLQYWEDAHLVYDAQFILMVLARANPLRHLAPLVYLVRHPRGTMRQLLQIRTSRDYESGPGLRSFTFVTMSYYLLLNLILALDAGASFRSQGTSRASFFHSYFQNSRSLGLLSSRGNENPHTVFWYSPARVYATPDLRATYSLQCFRLLVASYSILKEATLRDVALGMDPYKKSPYTGEPTAFDKGILIDVICRALQSISPAFSDLEPSLAQDPPLTLPHDSSTSTEPQRQSRFVGLPIEIHQYIYSFLPENLQSLVNLAATCSRLREICTPLIYVEPFPAYTKLAPDLGARSAALVKVLSSAPHLASHVRRLCVRVDSPNHSGYYEYPPLHLCLADSLTHLVELHLYAPCLCKDCSSEVEENCDFRTLDAIAAVARRWPNLSSLSLFDSGVAWNPPHRSPPTRDTPTTTIPQYLEKLTIVQDQCGVPLVPWATQTALMNASSQTLRHLVLHLDLERTKMHDLPVFPGSLERLVLTTNMTIRDTRLLLRKSFSSVRFLSLDSKHQLTGSPSVTLDLSGIFDDLVHLRVTTPMAWYDIVVPSSVVTIDMHTSHFARPSVSVTGSPRLEALCFTASYKYIALEGLLNVPGSKDQSNALQALRSFEAHVDLHMHKLPRLEETIATRLPQLEVLILHVGDFSNRPRREDYPMDDGLDDVQKAAAVSFFESCPGLNTISFNGIPDVWDPIGRFPARVWTRDSQSGGARMTGRAALPWKIGELWA